MTALQTVPNVLIVDDDSFVRTYLKDMLTDTGYALSEASNGEEALKLIATDHPEVVLLDLFMPKQSGLEALSRIREVSPNSRVIVISSMDSERVVEQALTAGARGFVAKPFHPLEVLDAVRRALEA